MDVEWLEQALDKLVEITRYIEIEEGNPAAALKLSQEIRRATKALGDLPHMGRPGKLAGTRELVFRKRYIVPYTVEKNRVLILRVWHTSRDLDTRK